jgi:hypothetical protein
MATPEPRHRPSVGELRREQRDEIEHARYVHTRGQVHGALLGGLIGVAAGLVIGLVIGFLAFDADSAGRFVAPAVTTVFAGWAGIVYWGGRGPEVEGETTTIYGAPEDGSSERPPEEPAPGT